MESIANHVRYLAHTIKKAADFDVPLDPDVIQLLPSGAKRSHADVYAPDKVVCETAVFTVGPASWSKVKTPEVFVELQKESPKTVTTKVKEPYRVRVDKDARFSSAAEGTIVTKSDVKKMLSDLRRDSQGGLDALADMSRHFSQIITEATGYKPNLTEHDSSPEGGW